MVVYARDIVCRFGEVEALRGVDLFVAPGEIHAVLGMNGAGKTTLLRVLTGAVRPTAGVVRVAGHAPDLLDARSKQAVRSAPAGDRSFYLRLSGVENLTFFGRLEGLLRREAAARAEAVLEVVGLHAARHRMVGLYSQGMKKRLSVARTMLVAAPVLVLDEATHDVDPVGADQLRALVAQRAADGVAVVWATQVVGEIFGFAHDATVLHDGTTRFAGAVSELVRLPPTRRFLLRLDHSTGNAEAGARVRALVGDRGNVDLEADSGHLHLSLHDGVLLGDVIASLSAAGIGVVSCNEERSQVEAALRRLATDGSVHDGVST